MGGGRKVGEKVLRWGRLHTCGCIRSTLGTERHFSRPANVIGTRQRPNRTVRGRSESRGRLGSAAQIVRCPQLNPLSARAQTIRSCLQRVARYPAALQKQRAGSGRQIPPHASRSRIREDELSS
jgi:hypothetical protein